MQPPYREEVLNVALALALHRHGIVAAPETIFRETLERGRAMPDVLVDYQGLRTVIEGKVDTGTAAEAAARRDAFQRVEQGIAHIGLAVLYPESLRAVPLPRLLDELERTPFRIAVFTESSESDAATWQEADVPHMASTFRRAYESLAEQDVVKRAAAIIRLATEEFAPLFEAVPGSLDRAVAALGIRQLTPSREAEETEEGAE